MTQIRLGGVYLFDGRPYRVAMMNECRARLDPTFRLRRTITDRLHGRTVEIESTPASVNVAPTSRMQPA